MTEPRKSCHQVLALLLALLAPGWACADIVGSVNAVRSAACDGRHPGVPPLRENARLDAAAHRLAQGADLRSALAAAGYHEVSSFSVSISNVPASGNIERILAQQFCQQVIKPELREIGSWRSGDRVWIALAEPFTPPAAANQAEVMQRVIALTNAARQHTQRCGSTAYAAAPALAASAKLSAAALAYARDMAAGGYMDHTGRDGSSPAERITRSGYRWREVGENLASGVMTPEALVAGWLASPAHCANLMSAAFREAGAAFAVNPHDQRGVYWAMEFGTPR